MRRPPRPPLRTDHHRRRLAVESLERRDLPAATLPGFLAAAGFGVTGNYAAIHANAVATDAAGDSIVTGSFRGTATFSATGAGGPFTSAGTQDTFVAKYGPAGNLVWVRTFAGQATTATTGSTSTTTYAVSQGTAIAVDGSGTILLAGSFQGTVNFGTPASPAVVPNAADETTDIVRLDPNGNLIWMRDFGPQGGTNQGLALALDNAGGVIVAGTYAQGATIGATTLTATGASEAVVARYDIATATPTWTFGTQGTNGSNAQATGVAVDGAGNVVLAGFFSGTVTLGSGSAARSFTSAGSTDALVWKLNPQGTLAWARSFGSADYDVAGGIAADGSNNVVVVGTFSDTVNFGTAGQPDNLTAGPLFDAFALKLDPTGQELWARGYVGPNGWAKGQAVAVDDRNQVHLAGAFSGTVDFDPGPTVAALTSVGSTDAFAAGLDAAGGYLYGVQAGRTNFNANLGIAVNPGGAVALAGTYSGSIGFGAAIGLPAAGTASGFVARLQTRATATPAAPVLEAASMTGTNNVTSIAAPTLDATASDPTNTLQLLRDGAVIAQRLGTGALLDPGPVPQGSHQYTVIQVSLAGISSPASPATTVTVITTPPAAPTGLNLVASDDSGTLGDGTTNVRQPRIAGKAGAGLAIQLLSAAGAVLGTATAASDGSFTVALPTLGDGAYSVQAVAIDAAANRSARSAAFALTILTAAPAAPTGLGLLAADDSGTIGDGLTNVRSPRLTGKAPAGLAVRLLAATGTVLGTTTAGSDGSFVVLLPSLADGTYPVQAVATDAAGNSSGKSVAYNLTIATARPATPATPTLLAADDSGTIGDGLTNVRNPRLLGTATPGLSVQIVTAAGAVLGTTTAAGDGSYRITLPSLADGSYSLQAVAVDPAANASPPSGTFALTILTAAPAAPTGLGLLAADDSGTVGDGKTNVRNPRLTGKAGAGVTVQVVTATGSILGSATAAGDGTFVVPLTSLSDGTYSVQAIATDPAANQSARSAAFSLTIQTSLPATPGTPSLLGADDSGAVGDGKTNVRSPRLTVAAAAGTTVSLVNAAGTVLGTGTTGTSGVATIAVGTNLADGTYAIRAITTDAAGNVSLPSPATTLVIATAPPTTPASPTILAADDTGTKGDGSTTVRRPRIAGVATPGNEVDWLDPTGKVIASTTAASDGSYILQAALALPNGTTPAVVRQVDPVGNIGASSRPLSLTLRATVGDYFADGKTDVAVWRPSNTSFYIDKPATETLYVRSFGLAGDVPIVGDFFGDGAADLAVYRPSTSSFYMVDPATNAANSVSFGGPGDIPVPGDYDGDGRTDIAVFRPSSDVFYVQRSATNTLSAVQFGGSGDIPVPGDYFGNGHADIAVYRPSTSAFYFMDPITGATGSQQFGGAGDTPVPADYDGDGKADLAVYRGSNRTFYVQSSATGKLVTQTWGLTGDVPIAGDYFGNGRASWAVFRPGNSTFYAVDPVSLTIKVQPFGLTNDRLITAPLTYAFNSNGTPTAATSVNAAQRAFAVDFVPAAASQGGAVASVSSTPATRYATRNLAIDHAIADLGLERWRTQ